VSSAIPLQIELDKPTASPGEEVRGTVTDRESRVNQVQVFAELLEQTAASSDDTVGLSIAARVARMERRAPTTYLFTLALPLAAPADYEGSNGRLMWRIRVSALGRLMPVEVTQRVRIVPPPLDPSVAVVESQLADAPGKARPDSERRASPVQQSQGCGLPDMPALVEPAPVEGPVTGRPASEAPGSRDSERGVEGVDSADVPLDDYAPEPQARERGPRRLPDRADPASFGKLILGLSVGLLIALGPEFLIAHPLASFIFWTVLMAVLLLNVLLAESRTTRGRRLQEWVWTISAVGVALCAVAGFLLQVVRYSLDLAGPRALATGLLIGAVVATVAWSLGRWIGKGCRPATVMRCKEGAALAFLVIPIALAVPDPFNERDKASDESRNDPVLAREYELLSSVTVDGREYICGIIGALAVSRGTGRKPLEPPPIDGGVAGIRCAAIGTHGFRLCLVDEFGDLHEITWHRGRGWSDWWHEAYWEDATGKTHCPPAVAAG
jgi:hypothetical protein